MRVIRYCFLTLVGLFGLAFMYDPAPPRPVLAEAAAPAAGDAEPEIVTRADLTVTAPVAPVRRVVEAPAPLPAVPDEPAFAATEAIAEALANPEPAEPAAVDVVSVAPAERTGMVNVDKLNLRSGPGTDFDALASLRRGDEVSVVADEGDGWLRVMADGQEGFVAAEYLDLSEPG